MKNETLQGRQMKKIMLILIMVFAFMAGLVPSQDVQKRKVVESEATFSQQTVVFTLNGISREVVWSAALKTFQLRNIEVLMANKDVLWGEEIIGGTLIVRIPERDQAVAVIMISDGHFIQTKAPFISVSISISGIKNGQLFTDTWWTTERKYAIEKRYYEYILDQIYGSPTKGEIKSKVN